jgi:hypothetical protein
MFMDRTMGVKFMSEFRRVKSETFQGGAKELRRVIEEFRAIPESPVERPLDKKWANELTTRIVNGFPVSFQWAVAELQQNGGIIRLRVNGQHSSWALAKLLVENGLPPSLCIHLDTYAVQDESGAVQLFRQFDARKSARSTEDISGAYQCFQPALVNCNRGILMKGVQGITWYRREVQKRHVHTGDDIYVLFDDSRLHPFFLMTHDILKDGKSNELKQVPVLAAAYGTWLQDAKGAAEFWRLTAQGTNRNGADAAMDLEAELIRLRDREERAKEKPNQAQIYAKCARAWLAYVDGSRVSNFKVNTKLKGLPSLGDLAE